MLNTLLLSRADSTGGKSNQSRAIASLAVRTLASISLAVCLAPASQAAQTQVPSSIYELLAAQGAADEQSRVNAINATLNLLTYTNDDKKWGKPDYWATPREALLNDGGDCEDFAISKYFILRGLGIEEDKLQMMYTNVPSAGEAHMVLTYQPDQGSSPLVLDNMKNDVLPTEKRPELVPIYSFNREGIWSQKREDRGRYVGSSKQHKTWTEFLERMNLSNR